MRANVVHAVERSGYAGRGRAAVVILTAVFLTIYVAATPTYVAATPTESPSMAEVEQSLFSEDWKMLINLLDEVDERSANPVLRLVKAHAYLAENYNDRSYCLFLSVTAREDLEQCLTWANALVEKAQGGNVVIARYLQGDVLARLGRRKQAAKAFDEADRRRPNHLLVLNARGVLHAVNGSVDEALCDLDAAAQIAGSSLADPHANLGALAIQRREGAEEAARDFDKAINASHGFSLARYGRGCVRCVLGESPQGMQDIQQAVADLGSDAERLRANLAIAYERLAASLEQELAAAPPRQHNPQMAIEAHVKALENGASPLGFLGQGPGSPINKMFYVYRDSGYNPEVRDFMIERLTKLAKDRPDLVPRIMIQVGRVEKTNRLLAQIQAAFPEVKEITTTQRFTSGINARVGGNFVTGALGLVPFGGAGGGTFGHYDVGARMDTESTTTKSLTPGTLPFTRQHKGFVTMADLMQQAISKATGQPTAAKGFKTASDRAVWDHGDWPFVPMYGLLYPSSPQSGPSAREGTVP